MFFAHLPSGYIMSNYISDKVRNILVTRKAVYIAGIVGAVAPDLDLVYFYLIDHCKTHHHKYISHWPILWLSMVFVSFMLLRFSNKKRQAFLLMVISLGGVLHMVLDSVVGDIWWLAPVLDRPYSMFVVTARYQPWWLNFILHWSLMPELLISAWGLVLYRSNTGKPAKEQNQTEVVHSRSARRCI